MIELRLRFRRSVLIAVPVLSWLTASAQAQWTITPQLGMNFAGDVEFRRGGPGASAGYFGKRVGFEVEFQRYQHFFKDSEIVPLDPAAPPNCTGGQGGIPCKDINTDARSLMGNVVVRLRPAATKWHLYATAGLGLMHAWTNEEGRQQDDLAWSVGGGVLYSFRKRAALRGDLRYGHGFADANATAGVYYKDYGFWRVTLGLTFGSLR